MVVALAALGVTPAFAAKGVITEVNPSGIGVANNAAGDNSSDIKNDHSGNNGAADGSIKDSFGEDFGQSGTAGGAD